VPKQSSSPPSAKLAKSVALEQRLGPILIASITVANSPLPREWNTEFPSLLIQIYGDICSLDNRRFKGYIFF